MNPLSLPARLAIAVGTLLMCAPACPQEPDVGPEQPFASLISEPARYVEDFTGFFSAPARWGSREWAQLGGVLAATSVAYQYDYDVLEHFGPIPASPDYHDVEDVMPVALLLGATWFEASRTQDPERYAEATTMVRAAALSSFSSLVFKWGLGRERPGPGVSRDGWYDGGRSMPSGHTALAFAVGTVFAESGTPKRRWVRRVIGYGLGVGMAYLRLKHDSHWFSDTIPGAALGIAAGRFAMTHGTADFPRGSLSVAPFSDGAMVTYSIPIR